MATNQKLDRWIRDYYDGFGDDLASIKVSILVCGPDMTKSNDNEAAGLRKKILERCSNSEIGIKAEHKELLEIGKKKLGQGFNLCTSELSICKKCDLIILFPSSCGSFAESGFFSNYDEVCNKMVVIIDKTHEKKESFLLKGPIKLCEMRKAKVLYCNYKDIEEIWKTIYTQIQECKAKKYTKSIK